MAFLSRYFQTPLYKDALNSYAIFAQEQKWPISSKLKMYNWAKAAFDSDLSEDEKRSAFYKLYEELRQHWGVFLGSTQYWPHDHTFDMLMACQKLSRQSGQTLLKLPLDRHSSECTAIFNELKTLSKIKEVKIYPQMPVAKFTHFFNPMLFPIFDTEVILEQVLKGVFRKEYERWCKQEMGLDPFEKDPKRLDSPSRNLVYTIMAADSINSADQEFMTFFSDWFKSEVASEPDEYKVLADINQYYATAFEFVVIGSVHLCGGLQKRRKRKKRNI